MSQLCVTVSLIVLFSIRLVYGFPGDTVMLMPPFEVRTMDSYSTHPSQAYTSQFQGNVNEPQQLLHTNVINKRPPQVPMLEKRSNQNLSVGEFMDALNEVPRRRPEEVQRLRAAATAGRDDSAAYSILPRPIGYSKPNYPPATAYQETPSAVAPPSPTQPKTPILKPDLSSLFAPVSTKVSGKLDGLLGLIISLLTSSSSGLQFNGIKDVLVEGIIKPLLVAKGGLKVLISKLTIPVIALLLINVEVLITVWWLWEECPAQVEPPPAYSKPTYNGNYNSYR